MPFFSNDTATTQIYTLSLHDALPILDRFVIVSIFIPKLRLILILNSFLGKSVDRKSGSAGMPRPISYAVFCLKKNKIDHLDGKLFIDYLSTLKRRAAMTKWQKAKAEY